MNRAVSVKFFCLILALVMVFSSIPASYNISIGELDVSAKKTQSQLEAEQAQIKKKQNNVKNKLAAVKHDASKAQEALDYINELIDSNKAEISNLNSQIKELDAQIADVEKQVSAKDKEIDENYKKFQDRLCAMYMSGDMTGGLELILCADSFEDVLSASQYVEAMAEYDKSIIDSLTHDKDDYLKKKKDIESKKATIQTKKKEISAKKEENDALAKEAKSKLAEIKKQQSQLESLQKKYDKDMANSKAQLDALINSLNNSNSSNDTNYTGGKFLWPTPSCYRISSPYGMRWGRLHKGIDIPAAKGSRIQAASSGTVVTRAWDANGYGNYVIVNHGGKYMTVYAHMSSVAVSRGQKVSKGQTIGYVGSTGRSTGPHLHFEIRVNGVAKNPMKYY